jgi:hypothetical protein
MKILQATNPIWFTRPFDFLKKYYSRQPDEVLSDWFSVFSPYGRLGEIHYYADSTQNPKKRLFLVETNFNNAWNSSKFIQ